MVVFAVSGLDRRVSNWASGHTPIFGSRKAASDASDSMRDATQWSALATALLTPSGDTPGKWVWSKAKGLAVEAVSVGATQTLVANVKNVAGRERPNESNKQSFPSAHGSRAFGGASLGRRNLQAIDMNGGLRTILDLGFTTLAAGTAWARVEAKAHYPSDVLAGAALGNFVTAFFCEAFLGLPENGDLGFGFEPDPHGMTLYAQVRF